MKENLLMIVTAFGLTCALLLLRHLFLRGGYNKHAVVKLTKFIDNGGSSGADDEDDEWPSVIGLQTDVSQHVEEISDAGLLEKEGTAPTK